MATSTKSTLARIRGWLWAIVALAVVAGGAPYLFQKGDVPRPTPVEKSYAAAFGGAFEMVDQNGRTVTDQTLRGKPHAIFFGFTRCPDVCPTTLSRMAALRKQLGPDDDKFNIVFVSVDPKHDTGKSVGEYLTLFDTPIIGLTGTDQQIDRIVQAYKVYYAKVPVAGGDYTIDHTASVFLMDGQGRFVATIDQKERQKVALDKLRRVIQQT